MKIKRSYIINLMLCLLIKTFSNTLKSFEVNLRKNPYHKLLKYFKHPLFFKKSNEFHLNSKFSLNSNPSFPHYNYLKTASIHPILLRTRIKIKRPAQNTNERKHSVSH